MNDVAALEEVCADAWPAVTVERLGQWRLRAADGFTSRANSALAVGDPGLPTAAALHRAIEFSHVHGIPPRAQVPLGAPIEEHIRAAGWRAEPPAGLGVLVMTGPLPTGSTPAGVTMSQRPPVGWWPLAVGAPEPTPAQRHVLAGREGLGFGTATDNGQTVGIVRGAVVSGVLHIGRLAVATGHRRSGIAVGLLAALADWAEQRGASTCVLQVTPDNEAAVSLYAKLGCRTHYRYRYWMPF